MNKNTDLNDFVIEILQDFNEIESITKVLKDSVYNENHEITMIDIGNTLELIISKMCNTKYSIQNCYFQMVF